MTTQSTFLTGALVELTGGSQLLIVREVLGGGTHYLCDYADKEGNSKGPRPGMIPKTGLKHASLPPHQS